MNNQERRAVRRVLNLVDGYLSTQPQSTLHGWRGGMMTWADLRMHVQAAEKLMRPKRRRKTVSAREPR